MPAEIDLLTLANHAEAVNGLLYLSGAGWDVLVRARPAPDGPPMANQFGIGVGLVVPWTETNRKHHLTILVEDEDGGPPLMPPIEGDVEVGRPAGTPEGTDLRSVLAVSASVVFPRPGGYRVVVELDGRHRTYSFRVLDQAGMRGPGG